MRCFSCRLNINLQLCCQLMSELGTCAGARMPSPLARRPSAAQADNPGLWNLHCHTDYHLFMGQKVYFLEQADQIPAPPPDLPACPATCTYNFAAWAPGTVRQMFGASGYPARRRS